jgi:methanogenic corrinoid protein MtbC1
LLLRASIEFSHPVLLQNIIGPFTAQLGELWSEGIIRVAEEHFASYILMKFLTNLRDSYDIPDSAPRILITTPRGQFHELGALLAAASAAFEGWKVIYFSANLPVSEIVSAIERTKAQALGLSVVYPFDDLGLRQELQVLQEVIPDEVKIIIGGNGARNFKDIITRNNTYIVEDLNQFRNILKIN